MDFRTEYTEVRRSRRLVVSFIATVGNYEYGFYWRFYQDGTIEHDIRLTGILSTAAVAPGERPPFGQLLNPEGLYGAIHQHFFNYRLDFDLDGVDNAVYEVDTVCPEPGRPTRTVTPTRRSRRCCGRSPRRNGPPMPPGTGSGRS